MGEGAQSSDLMNFKDNQLEKDFNCRIFEQNFQHENYTKDQEKLDERLLNTMNKNFWGPVRNEECSSLLEEYFNQIISHKLTVEKLNKLWT